MYNYSANNILNADDSEEVNNILKYDRNNLKVYYKWSNNIVNAYSSPNVSQFKDINANSSINSNNGGGLSSGSYNIANRILFSDNHLKPFDFKNNVYVNVGKRVISLLN